jgi:hypothetical protein
MTFNNETNVVIGNKHKNDQQQHEHQPGKYLIRNSLLSSISSRQKKGLMSRS